MRSHSGYQTTQGVISSFYLPLPILFIYIAKNRQLIQVFYFLQLEMILPDRAYGFFSHTHKAQKENMPLLDKVPHQLYLYSTTISSSRQIVFF